MAFIRVLNPYINDIELDGTKYKKSSLKLYTTDIMNFERLPDFTPKYPYNLNNTLMGAVIWFQNGLHIFCSGNSRISHYVFNGTTWVKLNDVPNGWLMISPSAIIEDEYETFLYIANLTKQESGVSVYKAAFWENNPEYFAEDVWSMDGDYLPSIFKGGSVCVRFDGHHLILGGTTNNNYYYCDDDGPYQLPFYITSAIGSLDSGSAAVMQINEGSMYTHDELHVVGGNKHYYISSEDSAPYTWHALTDLKFTINGSIHQISHLTYIAVINGRLWGFETDSYNVALIWDRNNDIWVKAYDLPMDNIASVAAAKDGTVYFVGSMDVEADKVKVYKTKPSYTLQYGD